MTPRLREELVFARAENEDYTESIYSYFEEVVIDDVLDDLVEEKGISESAATRMLYYGGYQIYSTIDRISRTWWTSTTPTRPTASFPIGRRRPPAPVGHCAAGSL